MNFSSSSNILSEYIIEELAINIVNGQRIKVVERKELDLLMKEMNFQSSGEVSDESMLSLGKKIGAQVIISGSLVKMGNGYRFRINAINVENAVREAASAYFINGKDQQITFLLNNNENSSDIVSNYNIIGSTWSVFIEEEGGDVGIFYFDINNVLKTNIIDGLYQDNGYSSGTWERINNEVIVNMYETEVELWTFKLAIVNENYMKGVFEERGSSYPFYSATVELNRKQ